MMSEETWKMSFGKFLEISFYNRSAKCIKSDCNHSIRDFHRLSFQCEGYVAVFEFVPLHSFALHIRDGMLFPTNFHNINTLMLLQNLPFKHSTLIDDFRLALIVLEKEIREILATRAEEFALAMADVTMIENELNALSISFLEELLKTYESLPLQLRDLGFEAHLKVMNSDRGSVSIIDKSLLNVLSRNEASELEAFTVDSNPHFDNDTAIQQENFVDSNDKNLISIEKFVESHFPMFLLRNTFIKASTWNSRIDTIYKFLESVRHIILHDQQQSQQAVNLSSSVPIADEDSFESKDVQVETVEISSEAHYSVNDAIECSDKALDLIEAIEIHELSANIDIPLPPNDVKSLLKDNQIDSNLGIGTIHNDFTSNTLLNLPSIQQPIISLSQALEYNRLNSKEY
jgi:hypothetical protein